MNKRKEDKEKKLFIYALYIVLFYRIKSLIKIKFSVKNNKVDYGEGLIDANSWEFFNSDYVTYLK